MSLGRCCEGGLLTAGCFHDHCKGPTRHTEYMENPNGGYALYRKQGSSVWRESATVTNQDLKRKDLL